MQFAEEEALVSYIKGEFVFLKNQVNPSCDNCSTKSGCGQVSSILRFQPKNTLKVFNSLDLKEGDKVIVGMRPDKLLKATVLMYLSPLLLLFVFSYLAKLLLGETASIFFGLFGLFIGLLMVKQYSKQSHVSKLFQPKLIRKIINIDVA